MRISFLQLTHFILSFYSTRGKYGEGAKQEKFRFALSLVFIQCVINAIFAKLCKYFQRNGKALCFESSNFYFRLLRNLSLFLKYVLWSFRRRICSCFNVIILIWVAYGQKISSPFLKESKQACFLLFQRAGPTLMDSNHKKRDVS